MSDDKPTLDDIATKDELEEFKSDVLEAINGGSGDGDDDPDPDPEGDEWPFDFEPDELDQVVETKTQAMLDHISDPEACDSAKCESLRDKYGFSGESGEESEPEESESDEEADAEDDDDEEEEPETGMFGAEL